ncbi:putative diguanylate cyclase AdrA [Caloramator mitchellensis]|uniref:Putative diguanylate cyclase AdrA n=1 Tax=Caloramator mitchellensis TaxID=908809 RepID=A0A0R3JY95_CALMK|nr:GGDEF domain-containing protein [Caloramator mitchellensis]KRQ86190.1 putative diguanylate cyclase AdrA [Caloramator mitchellensis]
MKRINIGSLRIVLVYVIISFIWILYSDALIMNNQNNLTYIKGISVFKGFIFVLTTAVLLYVLIKKETERRIKLWKYYATYDIMTGVYNRRTGLDLLEKLFTKYKKEDRDLTIIYADIDNLKQVNDTLGHSEGDRLIINISNILKKNIRNTDYIIRLGGDEFLIVLPDCDMNKAQKIVNRINDGLAELNLIFSRYEHKVSFGFATIEELYNNADEMVACADIKMYENKKINKQLNCRLA